LVGRSSRGAVVSGSASAGWLHGGKARVSTAASKGGGANGDYGALVVQANRGFMAARAVGETKSRLEIKAEIGAKLILMTEIQV